MVLGMHTDSDSGSIDAGSDGSDAEAGPSAEAPTEGAAGAGDGAGQGELSRLQLVQRRLGRTRRLLQLYEGSYWCAPSLISLSRRALSFKRVQGLTFQVKETLASAVSLFGEFLPLALTHSSAQAPGEEVERAPPPLRSALGVRAMRTAAARYLSPAPRLSVKFLLLSNPRIPPRPRLSRAGTRARRSPPQPPPPARKSSVSPRSALRPAARPGPWRSQSAALRTFCRTRRSASTRRGRTVRSLHLLRVRRTCAVPS